MSGLQATPPELTRRERDVLVALCRPAVGGDVFTEPASVHEIAAALVVTDAAVKQHLLHLYDKFGIADTGERRRVRLAREAIRLGAVARPEPTEASTSAGPEVRYVRSGDVNIAYQIVGDGPIDLVFVPGFISNLESAWWLPAMAAFYRRLALFSRLIIFDKRGTGMSDRVTGIADLETRMDDVRAVMDAVRSSRAALLGYSEGASMAALFAATYPERTRALLMYGALVALRWSPETPWALTREDFDRWVADIETRWGTAEYCDEQLGKDAPSRADDDDFRRWYATRLRLGASPSAASAAVQMAAESDIASILPAIRVPTLVLHRSGDRLVPVQSGRYLGAHIPSARYVELAGVDHLPWVGDYERLVQPIEDFLADVGRDIVSEPDRAVATVLFVDIVGSTQKAVELGDARWRELLERYHSLIRRELVRYRGREFDTAGDGFFASFDGPARAIRCACAVSDATHAMGVPVRIGLHTGECELVDGKLGGIAVHIGARIASEAGPGEVLVSGTVKDLVAGSDIEFRDRGVATLTGIPGQRQLFAVDRSPASTDRVRGA
jgi:pimeloyl-ACP methyl ester carboxylesterase